MKKTVAISLVLLIAFACKKDEEDTTPPVITITSPTNEQVVKVGSSFTLTGIVSDDTELATYRYEIHEADGHDHKSGSNESVEWKTEETLTISGTSHSISKAIAVPANAEATEYHVIVNAIDAAGNAAELVEITIDVEQ